MTEKIPGLFMAGTFRNIAAGAPLIINRDRF